MTALVNERRDAAAIEKEARGSVRPLAKSLDYSGDFINEEHERLARSPLVEGSVKIRHTFAGSLRREDAAKIYELAYFSAADTIDLGTNRGLSAAIAAGALRDAGKAFRVHTVDLDAAMTKRATKDFAGHSIANITAYTSDAAGWLRDQARQGRKFGFAFVDHSHAYEHVRTACEALGDVLLPDSFVAFHDFIDKRNFAGEADYGVAPAAIAHLDERFAWRGGCGCMGVFQFEPKL